MHRMILAAVTAVFVMAAAPAVSAETLRVPKTGTPAFTVEAPPGWISEYDDANNLLVIAPDRFTILILSVNLENPGVKVDDIAAGALQLAHGEPYSSKSPGDIAGHPGFIYGSHMVSEEGMVIPIVFTLAWVDKTHVAEIAWMLRPDATSAQQAALEAVAASVKLVN